MSIQLHLFLKIIFKGIKITDHTKYINLTYVSIFVQEYSSAKKMQFVTF